MKNQYFGDVNDFRKYGLLRSLILPTRLKLGVCWMLTEGDGSKDGKILEYLDEPDRYERCDVELFRFLKEHVDEDAPRRVAMIEDVRLLPRAVFQSQILTDDLDHRTRYFDECGTLFKKCDLVFFDPDNGIEIASCRKGHRNSSKYVFWDELHAVYASGKSVLVYQHFRRTDRDKFIEKMAGEMQDKLSNSSVFPFRTPHVVFLLAAQPRHAAAFRQQWQTIADRWPAPSPRNPPQIRPHEHRAR